MLPDKMKSGLVLLLTFFLVIISTHAHMKTDEETPQDFLDNELIYDSDHLREHLHGQVELGQDTISRQEQQFYFFQQHDMNQDSQLDGLEILTTLTHTMPFHYTETKDGDFVQEARDQAKEKWMIRITDMVDRTLRDFDKDNDGYLSFPEYGVALYSQKVPVNAGTT